MVLTVMVTSMTMLVTMLTVLVTTMTAPVSTTIFFHSLESKLLRIVILMLPIVKMIVTNMMETVRVTATLNDINLTFIWFVRMLTTLMPPVSILPFMF